MFRIFSKKHYKRNSVYNGEILQHGLDELSNLSCRDFQIIGLEKKGGEFYAAVVRSVKPTSSIQEHDLKQFYLCRLLDISEHRCLAMMNVFICAGCKVWIGDWRSIEKGYGYGRLLMNSVIYHLRNAGFQSVSGSISPVDSGCGADYTLHRIYQELGFKITEGDGWPRVHMELRAPLPLAPMNTDEYRCIRKQQYF